MSSKFDVEIKNLIKVYEANDNIEPGSASGFASALGDLGKAAFGAVNYYLNFQKFYKYALRKAYEISEEARQINKLRSTSPNDRSFLKRKINFQYNINNLKEDTRKWREYLTPLSSKSAKKSKAALEVIESIIQDAEYGNLKKRSNQNIRTPQPTPLPTASSSSTSPAP